MDGTILPVTEIQRFCMHDGPGVRTVVFLKGCPLRCKWCHNPETQAHTQQILLNEKRCILCRACERICHTKAHKVDVSHLFFRSECDMCEECIRVCPTKALYPAMTYMSTDEILKTVERDRAFYGENGGLTLSGGEPLLHANGVYELLSECKKKGIGTVIETCGYFHPGILEDIVNVTDLFLWDIKDTDRIRHKEYTGEDNEIIIKNLFAADRLGAKTRLRCILAEGVNTDARHYRAIADIASSLNFCEGVEIIPYHAYGGSKMLLLGKPDNGRSEWIPSEKTITHAKSIIKENGINVL